MEISHLSNTESKVTQQKLVFDPPINSKQINTEVRLDSIPAGGVFEPLGTYRAE